MSINICRLNRIFLNAEYLTAKSEVYIELGNFPTLKRKVASFSCQCLKTWDKPFISHPCSKYRVIRNDYRDFNNLSYKTNLRQDYVVAPMDQEILKAPVRYVTKIWSVVLLNKKIHILLSQEYCVWQVVKTPKIISNNPVYAATSPHTFVF